MRQSAQFARLQPIVPQSRTQNAEQLDYSRPVSRVGSVGFAALSVGLAVMTFVVTTGGIALPDSLNLTSGVKGDPNLAIVREPVAAASADVVFEPKTTGRLPVFGGMTIRDQ